MSLSHTNLKLDIIVGSVGAVAGGGWVKLEWQHSNSITIPLSRVVGLACFNVQTPTSVQCALIQPPGHDVIYCRPICIPDEREDKWWTSTKGELYWVKKSGIMSGHYPKFTTLGRAWAAHTCPVSTSVGGLGWPLTMAWHLRLAPGAPGLRSLLISIYPSLADFM